jgi:hypothetical protein
MQTEIALSTTEAEYIALSQAMREVLPIIWLLEEAKHHGVPVLNAKPKVHCKVFEDNAGAIEIANVPKMRPRTKHLNIKYHHFREEVRKGTVSIYYTRTEDQIAYIFTKPLPETSFIKFRERIMGWYKILGSIKDSRMHYKHYIEMRECEHTGSQAMTWGPEMYAWDRQENV